MLVPNNLAIQEDQEIELSARAEDSIDDLSDLVKMYSGSRLMEENLGSLWYGMMG